MTIFKKKATVAGGCVVENNWWRITRVESDGWLKVQALPGSKEITDEDIQKEIDDYRAGR